MEIKVVERVLAANDLLAKEIRELLAANGVTSLNIMGTPGAGKTSVIEQVFSRLKSDVPMAVIEGDIATSLDAKRLSELGVIVVQINTGGQCHLDGGMIKPAISSLDLSAIRLLFVENVGNLVCPAEFDIGESKKVLITSVTEGHDKVQKYPLMFRLADAVVLNKIDLLPYVNFDLDSFRSCLADLNPNAPIFDVSCRVGEGISELAEWVKSVV